MIQPPLLSCKTDGNSKVKLSDWSRHGSEVCGRRGMQGCELAVFARPQSTLRRWRSWPNEHTIGLACTDSDTVNTSLYSEPYHSRDFALSFCCEQAMLYRLRGVRKSILLCVRTIQIISFYGKVAFPLACLFVLKTDRGGRVKSATHTNTGHSECVFMYCGIHYVPKATHRRWKKKNPALLR